MADSQRLRTLYAIHLATALSIGDAQLEVITYDRVSPTARTATLADSATGHST